MHISYIPNNHYNANYVQPICIITVIAACSTFGHLACHDSAPCRTWMLVLPFFFLITMLSTVCYALRVPVRPLMQRCKLMSVVVDAAVPPVKDHQLLTDLIAVQGTVCRGYGRGSKKLGIPTANLPQFDTELQELSIDRGIYFGWACVADEKQIYPCVTNIGISPTFVGQENAVNIVETYLIDRPVGHGDFYGKLLRLALVGYIRPEMKFDSIAQLVEQIQKDVDYGRSICNELSIGSVVPSNGENEATNRENIRGIYKHNVQPWMENTSNRTGHRIWRSSLTPRV